MVSRERMDEYHEQSRPLQTVFTRDDMTWKLNDRFAPISSVYTFPDERRRHYAQSLVYHVTQKESEMGYIPISHCELVKKVCIQLKGNGLRALMPYSLLILIQLPLDLFPVQIFLT